jgi:hypothetical protein
MSMYGRRTADIRSVIQTALNGQALSGLTHLTVTLTKSSDPLTLLTPGGVVECIDGAFTVIPRSRTGAAMTPQTTGGRTQRIVTHTFAIQWAVNVGTCDLDKLDTDLIVISDAVIDLIDAALEPQSGAQYNVTEWSTIPPMRNGDYLIYEVQYVVKDPWSRT